MTDVARKEKAVTARRERTVFSQAQLDELESYFKRDKYLDYENKYHLGKKLNLSDAKIQVSLFWSKSKDTHQVKIFQCILRSQHSPRI